MIRDDRIQPSALFERLLRVKTEDVYGKLAGQLLFLSIRDVMYRGDDVALRQNRRDAVRWFSNPHLNHYLDFETVAEYIGADPHRLWLQLRRFMKVDPGYLSSFIKYSERLGGEETK